MAPLLLFPHPEMGSAGEVGEGPIHPGFPTAHYRMSKLFLNHGNVLDCEGCTYTHLRSTSGNEDNSADPQGGGLLLQHQLLFVLAELVEWMNQNYKME